MALSIVTCSGSGIDWELVQDAICGRRAFHIKERTGVSAMLCIGFGARTSSSGKMDSSSVWLGAASTTR